MYAHVHYIGISFFMRNEYLLLKVVVGIEYYMISSRKCVARKNVPFFSPLFFTHFDFISENQYFVHTLLLR